MTAQINGIWSEERNTVDRGKQCIECCRKAMQKLREHIQSASFETTDEEVYFFKTIKPRFHAHLIYYLKIYNIEINRPTGSKIVQNEYLEKEFYKLRLFFESHTSFYHYYRSGETYLDEQYFTREKSNTHSGIQFLYIDADPSFSTLYDYQVAKIMANEMLSDYLNSALSGANSKPSPDSTTVKPALVWSDSKVSLAELLYAFHASGVFNNSQADIKTITDYMCGIFNVRIGNIYKVFEEIRLRKKNRTVFLDSLRQNLIQRMDRDDSQAL